jgi:hypothetical protein
MTGRPVPRTQLPEGVTCAVSRNGRISDADHWQLERFQEFLTADKAATTAEEKRRLLREYLADTDERDGGRA